MDNPPAQIPEDRQATEYLANERTFLAWIRTSVAIISMGFVIAKFPVWLESMGQKSGSGAEAPAKLGASFLLGIGMMGLGALLTILAGMRYHTVNRQIRHGKVMADHGLIFFVTIVVAVLAATMIGVMLIAAASPLPYFPQWRWPGQ